MTLKDLVKQVIPHGIGEYSKRRHDYIRLGFSAGQASRIALSRAQHQSLCEARLDLVPTSILSSLRTCVDAGAHAGSWTQALLDRFTPERVLAVECEPRMLPPLQARFAARPNVTVVEAALAGSEGRGSFHQLRHPAGSSLMQPRLEVMKEFESNSWDVVGTMEVQKITYDQLVAGEGEVSILKLDIQGAEMEVLSNSQGGLGKTRCIILEVTFVPHYQNDAGFPELHQLMAGKGFGLYRLSSAYHRGARVLFADAVYVREDILCGLAPERLR
jgi:FkbM family methyltransferase